MTALELRPARNAAARLAQLPDATLRKPNRRVVITWSQADGALVCEQGARRWIELLAEAGWPPGAPVPRHDGPAPADAKPIGAFHGHERRFALGGGVEATFLRGIAETGGVRRPLRRLRLEGPVPALEAACASLGDALALEVPHRGLAAEALDQALRPGGPEASGATVGEFAASALPALAWPVLRWTNAARAGSPEGVHQMRVAVRRLRSVLALLRRPLACPAINALRTGLRDLAGCLGAARDWDVFLEVTGAELGAGLGEAAASRLLAAARRHQAAARTALAANLASQAHRALELRLACAATLRLWEHVPTPAALLAEASAPFAASALARAYRHVRRLGRGFNDLPADALHDLRKVCKRLRYATETFAPLFPHTQTRRYARRLAAVQATLGALNDGVVAAHLLAQLDGAGRGFAGGWAAGLAAGREPALRHEARAAWKRFRATAPFWT